MLVQTWFGVLLAKQLQDLLSPRDIFMLSRRKDDRPWEVSGHAMVAVFFLLKRLNSQQDRNFYTGLNSNEDELVLDLRKIFDFQELVMRTSSQ